jgi:uncharacterized membrane protein
MVDMVRHSTHGAAAADGFAVPCIRVALCLHADVERGSTIMGWLAPGVVIGIGLGGFVDGIVLHQIAQWHNMGSAVVPPVTMEAMKLNMMWDGLFHAGTWLITAAGVFMLWRSGRRGDVPESPSTFTGQLLLGWGAFNLVEGAIDHHLLNLHHVRDLPVHVPLYDWLFLGFGGIGLMAIGALLMTRVRRPGAVRAA